MQPDSPKPSERGFWHLTALQFQGAFSDNILKQLIILGLVAAIYKKSEQSLWNGVVGGIFVLPGFLVSIWAGFLADKFSKRTLTLATKAAEIVTMTAATCVMMLGSPQAMFMPALFVLFLLANQYTFFTPNKYGIIPELVAPSRLSWANGVIELTTFVAIILGTGIVPFLLKGLAPRHFPYIGMALIALAVIGFVAGLGIDHTPPANPQRRIEWNFFPEFKRYCQLIGKDRTLFLTNIGTCYFWFIGALVLNDVNVWGEASLKLKPEDAGFLYIVLALGIGIGAYMAGAISRGKVELGLIPLGGIGMGIFSIPLCFAAPSPHGFVLFEYFSLFMLGMSAGFFSLPLNALLQEVTSIEDRGGVIAANNLFNSGAMVLSAVFLIAFNALLDPPPNALFLVVSGLSMLATWIIVKLLPESLFRFIAFMLTSTVYRIRPINLENLPEKGGALILCNHVSYVDALLLGTISPRPIRFVAYADFFEKPLLGLFLKTTRSIPIAAQQKPREMIQSLKVASDALNAGEVVCLFPEGQLTRTGQMLPFNRGFELILRDAPAVPIIPVYLDGVWGSIFSFEGQKYFWKRPRQIPYPVRIVFGESMPADSTPFAVRQRIEELGADAAIAAKPDRKTLDRYLVDNARRNWGSFAMVDTLMPAMNWGRALTGAIVFARKLAPLWGEAESVGVLLPPSVAAALVNFAAALSGRSAINLNYTIGQEALNHCARQSGITTVVTSIKFLEKVGLVAPVQAINLEQNRPTPTLPAKLAALLVARFFPAGALARYCKAVRKPSVDSLATIIFSSGSTGVPKGVPLSHFNVVSNIESFRQAIQLFPADRLLGVLPFFHSFGYTVSLWGSAMLPFGCVFHNNPLDAKTIGELAEKERVTLMIATPTFLLMYAKRIPGGQFGGVKIVVSGAERLPDTVVDAFKERFGIEPLQGYGATECSPVVSVNVADHRSPGVHQLGAKSGSVGRALPGVTVRALDADSGEPCGANAPGLLYVKGPNVMSGYLDLPEKTAEVLKDGWYNTGDVGTIDEDGFIFITGRLSRFSKIGGEMVPHGTVEEKMQELLGMDERVLAVAGVPDEKKGEQLAVLHTLDDAKLADLLKKLPGAGLPNLYIPKKEMFFKVEALPMLGTGKLDLKGVNQLAAELAGGGEKKGAAEEGK